MNRERLLPFAVIAAALVALTGCTAADTDPNANASTAPTPATSSLTDPAEGIVVGDGPVTVELWTDLSCPYCAVLEETTGDDLEAWVADGTITLSLHPMNYVS
ncbi:DsbA family protein, partial [Microbacterium sp. zg.Y909]|uniref:DsbA family protein n=1 Tax=Microbacterium sp. zg.Y909 TaxID=2969413 RepID=UPI00214BA620